ncbi:hypothetical protein CYLTODRAFT_456087 [Cylindrobasidium torrendii FP15055 ss-10]|uniref:Fork-head domain-containing protein n=1 Tax=Cylindrobasidium torrendii FP15055 ss-10 TaxID=1314674 RepID=A0A0D7B828_9AGAR|nr:hypothetical protein CYLTODRAFT_456087 [Cylindrobasidium torrendii FP15055 ss-10]
MPEALGRHANSFKQENEEELWSQETMCDPPYNIANPVYTDGKSPGLAYPHSSYANSPPYTFTADGSPGLYVDAVPPRHPEFWVNTSCSPAATNYSIREQGLQHLHPAPPPAFSFHPGEYFSGPLFPPAQRQSNASYDILTDYSGPSARRSPAPYSRKPYFSEVEVSQQLIVTEAWLRRQGFLRSLPPHLPITLGALQDARNIEEKPPYTMHQLAAVAIFSHPDHCASSADIREMLKERFPYFRDKRELVETLKHALSSYALFKRTKGSKNRRGRGGLWVLDVNTTDSTVRRKQEDLGPPTADRLNDEMTMGHSLQPEHTNQLYSHDSRSQSVSDTEPAKRAQSYAPYAATFY